MADARYKAADELTDAQVAVRDMADTLAITYHTNALREIGSFRFEMAGFARIPRLTVSVWCKEQDMPSLIPLLRQMAQSHLGELGWGSKHLAVTPSVGRGSRRKFTDQHGAGRMGTQHDVSFELSGEIAGVIDWLGYTKKLAVRENGLPV